MRSFGNASLRRLGESTICGIDSVLNGSPTPFLLRRSVCRFPTGNLNLIRQSRIDPPVRKEKFPFGPDVLINKNICTGSFPALFLKRDLSYFFRVCKYEVYCSYAWHIATFPPRGVRSVFITTHGKIRVHSLLSQQFATRS